MQNRILIVDPVHEVLMETLSARGCSCDYQPDIQRQEIISKIADYEGLVIRTKTIVDREVIDAAKNLKFIGRVGAGMDNVDEPYALTKQITCLNAPEGNRDAVAEHAIGLLLTLLNKIPKGHTEISKGIWDREGNRGVELGGKTIGLIGYGNAGQALAKKLSGFDVKVLAYDKYLKNFENKFANESFLQQICDMAAVVSLHVPLTMETKGFYNKAFFAAFKHPVYLVNTSRGEVLPLADVIDLLDSGKLLGVALDVLANEKFSTYSPIEQEQLQNLVSRTNVVLSPHVAGWTVESYRKLSTVLSEKIIKLLDKHK